MNAEILEQSIRRRLSALAEDTAHRFGITKEEAMEWLREMLTGEAEPVREVGVDMDWRGDDVHG